MSWASKHRSSGVSLETDRPVAREVQHGLGGVREAGERLEVEDPCAALDRVDAPEDGVQGLAVAGRLGELEVVLLGGGEVLDRFLEELGQQRVGRARHRLRARGRAVLRSGAARVGCVRSVAGVEELGEGRRRGVDRGLDLIVSDVLVGRPGLEEPGRGHRGAGDLRGHPVEQREPLQAGAQLRRGRLRVVRGRRAASGQNALEKRPGFRGAEGA
ncbi:MAG: hypothetical protein AAGB93_06945 [Planctomycetota bacterium]